MILGAITNSWREQVFTADLARLVERARRRGAAHIELRQTYLGQYEEGAEDYWRPAIDKLSRLVRTFPVLTFNLAIAYPCLTREPGPASPRFQASLEGARALGASIAPMLRVVDTARFDSTWEEADDLPSAAVCVAELAEESARQGVRLCLENSGQPIRSMALLVREARNALSAGDASYLGLCVDPINSMLADPGSDPIAEIESLPLDDIFMVHFKQTQNGQLHPTVDDGDLDLPRLVKVLKGKGYEDLAILEIPPGERVFDNFKASVDYLETLMGSE